MNQNQVEQLSKDKEDIIAGVPGSEAKLRKDAAAAGASQEEIEENVAEAEVIGALTGGGDPEAVGSGDGDDDLDD